jgi:hypothetical protein
MRARSLPVEAKPADRRDHLIDVDAKQGVASGYAVVRASSGRLTSAAHLVAAWRCGTLRGSRRCAGDGTLTRSTPALRRRTQASGVCWYGFIRAQTHAPSNDREIPTSEPTFAGCHPVLSAQGVKVPSTAGDLVLNPDDEFVDRGKPAARRDSTHFQLNQSDPLAVLCAAREVRKRSGALVGAVPCGTVDRGRGPMRGELMAIVGAALG